MAEQFSYNVEIQGLPELLARLEAATRSDVITRSLYTGAQVLAQWSKDNRLSGPRPKYLGVKSGWLRASITASVNQSINGNEYEARVGTNVKYARIHEYGGTITAKNAPYLMFQVANSFRIFTARGGFRRLKTPIANMQWVRVKSVNIPARPFLRPALDDEDNRQKLVNILTENISKALEKQE